MSFVINGCNNVIAHYYIITDSASIYFAFPDQIAGDL